MIENKREIAAKLGELLKLTIGGSNIETLKYVKEDSGEEFVLIDYTNGYTRWVNVTADSGCALIAEVTREVLKH